MYRVFFVLGKNPTLSCAEIFAYLDLIKNEYRIEFCSKEVLCVQTEQKLETTSLLHTLGGTIKVGEILDNISLDQDSSNFEEITSVKFIASALPSQRKGKVHIGMSLYSAGGDTQLLIKLENQLRTFLQTIKDNLKENRISVGYVQQKERILSSVSVEKNELLTKGVELILILTKQSILVAKTLAVQEFEQFSFRDYGRPARDKKSGIMPPKLARMMINLIQIDKNATLLDPFCGSGTVLQEAVMMDYTKMIGSDISPKAAADTKQNIDWLFDHMRNKTRTSYNIRIEEADATRLSEKIPGNSIDAIVSEPYLGPTLHGNPTEMQINNLFSELSGLYLKAFEQFSKVCKPKSRVAFIFPSFEINGRMLYLPILDKMSSFGFKGINPIPSVLHSNPAISLTPRQTIVFSDAYHFVKREIILLEKN
jgi:tRNA G10  N-methylase Trm11